MFDDIIIADASTVKRRFDLDKYILHNIAGFSFKLESLDLVDWQALINRLENLSDEELAAPCRLAVLVDGGRSGFEIGRTGVTNADFLDQLTRIFPRDIGAASPDSNENHSLEDSKINIPALPNQDERLQPSIVPPITVSTEMEATAPSEPLNVFGDSSVTDLPLSSEIEPPVDTETSVILNSLTHVPGGAYESPHFVSDSILPLRFRELVC